MFKPTNRIMLETEAFLENLKLESLYNENNPDYVETLATIKDFKKLVPNIEFYAYDFLSYSEVFPMMLNSKDPSFLLEEGVMEDLLLEVKRNLFDKGFISSFSSFYNSIIEFSTMMENKDVLTSLKMSDLEAFVELCKLVNDQEYMDLHNDFGTLFSYEYSNKLYEKMVEHLQIRKNKHDKETEEKWINLENEFKDGVNRRNESSALNFYYNSSIIFKSYYKKKGNNDTDDQKLDQYIEKKIFRDDPLYYSRQFDIDNVNFGFRHLILSILNNDLDSIYKYGEFSKTQLNKISYLFPRHKTIVNKLDSYLTSLKKKELYQVTIEEIEQNIHSEEITTIIEDLNKELENRINNIQMKDKYFYAFGNVYKG
ncbi:MAG: hypothetical protein E7184_02015 [Erysipelotrichaceae bacterium]|nr:hypothetical protein [Erysipelotrichaceae bacterium]